MESARLADAGEPRHTGSSLCDGHSLNKRFRLRHFPLLFAGHREGKRDACLGDSGGPLVINFDGRWTLIGITSAGFGCAVEKQPGIYHKVATTAAWLAANIRENP